MKLSLVIGGGFFGLYLAEYIAQRGQRVVLVERDAELMGRASLHNQARVHNGYHYPRSILTALRSRVSFPRFVEEFQGCVHSDFEKYYMIGKVLGKVSARQFEVFCHRIGAPCEPAPTRITKLVNRNLVEAVYQTVEYAFDAVKLRILMRARIESAGVELRLGTEVIRVKSSRGDRLAAVLRSADGVQETLDGLDHVFNCTYSGINAVNCDSGLEIIPLKHELTEMALVHMPEEIATCGVTVMCGPFFSFMPFPSQGCHSFSHVRYTPHYEWQEGTGPLGRRTSLADRTSIKRQSSWGAMWRDARRYMPILSETRYLSSVWETKTVLPRSESDDSRPILFRPNHGLRGYHCVMGGKIDNVYDAVSEIERLGMVG